MPASEKIVFYTSPRCPWAHRAAIALDELKVPYEEVIIDLDKPRTPEYLAVNPRGKVPTIQYGDNKIIRESAVIAQFLADLHPPHLLPPSNTPEGALKRADIAFFVDAFLEHVQKHVGKLTGAKTDAEVDEAVAQTHAGIVKEVEPLLKDAKPFFGGSDHLTLAEVLTGGFVLRLYKVSQAGIFPTSLTSELASKAPNFARWAEAVIAHPSVNRVFPEDDIFANYRKRIAAARGQA